ncbi:N-acetyltransferase-like protein [Leptotrombidium deliense]|uniref:N-terminal methionine N(alpha)-acetyltransferase NatE n=1 Tax=Leptotrombidium deliense TaxID=299467 RepID=A0A443ST28_9ACAR|nr:N-acetyltransferase-like protein [Leptotrombidium deliense]
MAVSSIVQRGNESFKDEDDSDYYYSKAKPKRIGRIELGDVTQHNIKLLRKLNQVVFPVIYNDKFYKDVLEAGELAKLAYYNDIVVGGVCCRIDNSENMRRLYIMTLGCLAPYRRLGIGTKMLLHVLDYAKNHDHSRKFDAIFLHVQINNESAINFYKKFGFEIVETKQNYYKRIEPADAHVLQKSLNSGNDDEE